MEAAAPNEFGRKGRKRNGTSAGGSSGPAMNPWVTRSPSAWTRPNDMEVAALPRATKAISR